MAPKWVLHRWGCTSPVGRNVRLEGYMEWVRARIQRFLVLASVFLCSSPTVAVQLRGVKTSAKQVTRASWYGKSFGGRRTAGGTIYDPHRLTAAHRSLHFGSKVRVTELRTGRSVVVQITDRGPFSPGRGIDLSYAAARQLGIVQRGVARVRVEPLERDQPVPPVVTASRSDAASWLPKALVE